MKINYYDRQFNKKHFTAYNIITIVVFIIILIANYYYNKLPLHKPTQSPQTQVYVKSGITPARAESIVTKPLSVSDKIKAKFGEAGEDAVKIAYCESRLNPESHNYNPKTSDDSYGLFQINRFGKLAESRPSPEWLKNEDNNINYAFDMFVAHGKRFGTTSGWYNCSKVYGIK